jgi:YidC/Oxa1 family membrane protein insertase
MSDRTRTAMAFAIIIGILLIWTFFNRPAPKTETAKPVIEDTVVTREIEIDEPEYEPVVEDTIVVDRSHVRFILSSYGGSVASMYLKDYDVDIVPPGRRFFASILEDSLDNVAQLSYVVSDDSVVFTHDSGDRRLVKTYRFDHKHGFSLHILTDATSQSLSLKAGLNITELMNQDDDLRNFNVYIKDEKVETVTKKIKDSFVYTGDLDWFALRSKYFILAVNNETGIERVSFLKIPGKIEPVETRDAAFGCYYMGGAKDRYGAEITASEDLDISVLLLPMDRSQLAQYERGYEEIASGGFWGPISRVIMAILNFMYSLIGNYGFAIMIFALVIKLIFFPLSRQMIMSQHKMQMIQPELKKIQQKYKNDPQRLNQEMMHLYKTYKVNPFSGCLPLLIQMPIFFALFRTLTTSIEFRNADFIFWITDLSLKDPYYVLPISMGIMMLVQSLSTTVDPRQRLIVIFMPVVMVLIFINMPSGLQLYWFMYNILTLVEHFVIKRGGRK